MDTKQAISDLRDEVMEKLTAIEVKLAELSGLLYVLVQPPVGTDESTAKLREDMPELRMGLHSKGNGRV